MSHRERIETGRDEASFAEVFTDEEHDHASDSARNGIDHIEAAAITKDYVASRRTPSARAAKA